MISERNMEMLKKLEDYTFHEEIYPVYELLKKHPDRIRFVKDHNGVKNLVFLTTTPKDSLIFEVPYFLITTHLKNKNPLKYESKVRYLVEDILTELETFFKSSNEVMFVGIGFEENEVTKWDYMEILNILEQTKCNIVDAYVTLRRFPEWYENEAELPIYIFKEKEYLKEIESYEKKFLLNKKQELLNQIHDVVEENNEEEFYKLSKYLKKINNQLSEYK